MKNKLFAAIFLSVISTSNAFAGVGYYINVNCGQWLYERQLRRSQADGLTPSEQWVTGYASGINVSHPADFLNGVNSFDFLRLVDNSCQQYRGASIDAAVNHAIQGLISRRGR
jgi:hypothetical protein